ncbi:hypothetical protein MVEN_00984400 [Mycena venus]|uniref:F-box domain-containing protein n=1 Tax=Mycena venus TaxID=2733690 RepID=A0A8H6YEE0_9AGAR|nr:hypothetical protein MVEN_00984400 [Mycena venus]
MHAVLLLDDVLRQILDLCPRECLPAVARTCRSWTDPALDGIWSHLGSVVPLLNLIPGLIHVEGVYDADCKGSVDLSAFNSYAHRVKHITQRHNTRIHPKLLAFLCAKGTPLFRLTTTRLLSTDPDCAPAALKRGGPSGSKDYIETLLHVATSIERVRLRGLADPYLNHGISQMSNLCSLSLRTGSFLTAETFAAISIFPYLAELEIEAGHIDIDALIDAWSPASEASRFPALKKLRICAQEPVLELVLQKIPPGSLHTLRIEATTPAGLPPVRWSNLFDLITTTNSYTLYDLTIEQHLNDVDLDTIPATSLSHTQNNRITFDIIRRLAPLRRLRYLTIDMTRIPNLSDQDIDALTTWWPDLAHLDLGSLHSSECHPSTGRPHATLACLPSFASSMPKLDTLILPLDLSAVPALPASIGSSALSRATFSSPIPPDPSAIAPYLHSVFPRLAVVDGTDQHETQWSQVQKLLWTSGL